MRIFSFNTLHESYQLRHEPEQYIAAAERIWKLILAVAITVSLVSAGYGIFEFVAPTKMAVTEATAGGITGFNRAQLSQVVEFYGKRQATFENLMSGE